MPRNTHLSTSAFTTEIYKIKRHVTRNNTINILQATKLFHFINNNIYIINNNLHDTNTRDSWLKFVSILHSKSQQFINSLAYIESKPHFTRYKRTISYELRKQLLHFNRIYKTLITLS